jgi:lactoylglutathione lyase
MKFGYTIVYVADVEKTLSFYEKAFNLNILFLHESKEYGELATGVTTLAFASEKLIELNGIQFKKNSRNELSPGFEIAFVYENVADAYQNACKHGAISIQHPIQKPWGQTVAYVRDINGIVVEICSPLTKD